MIELIFFNKEFEQNICHFRLMYSIVILLINIDFVLKYSA